MTSFTFWQRWLLAASLSLILFGLALACFPSSPIFGVLQHAVNESFWGTVESPTNVRRFQSWVLGAWGATIAGWGVFSFFLGRYAFPERRPWAWRGFAAGICLWYLLDTAISLLHGVVVNAIFNTLILLVFAMPLAGTWAAFFRPPPPPTAAGEGTGSPPA
jgi:hypothetical protein